MKKDYLIELWDWTTDVASVTTPFLNSLGIPVTPQATIIIGKSIKMLLKMGIAEVFKDYKSRQLSSMQQKKLDDVTGFTIKTVYQLIEKDGWEDNHPESAQYTQYAVEYAEDVLNKALTESRQSKRMLLGAYLGSTIYTLNFTSPNWDNVFYLSSLIEQLTLRQIILVKLIVDHFNGIKDGEDMICVTDNVVISELKELANQNMWVGLVSFQPNPTHIAIPLKYMCPTGLAKDFVSYIIIPDSLQENVDRIVKSLDLKPFSQSGLPDPFKGLIKTKLSSLR